MQSAGTKTASIMLQIVLSGRLTKVGRSNLAENNRCTSRNGRVSPKTTALSRQMRGTGTRKPDKKRARAPEKMACGHKLPLHIAPLGEKKKLYVI